MTAWSALLPQALVGTDRHTGSWPPAGAWPDDIAAVVAQLADAPQRATGLLRAAALVAVVQKAAEFGRPFTAPLPAAAGEEPCPAAEADPRVAWLLAEGPLRSQHEVLAVLARRGQRLPEAWLPKALELGRRHGVLRAAVSAVLGTRGAWLAAQRDDWRWAVGTDSALPDDRWTEGTLPQRAAWLRQLRAESPAAAREHLATALPGLPANERAELLGALVVGLAADDEDLLEQALDDRSREVRQAAAALLLRLPGSAFSGRAVARIQPLLRRERVLLTHRWVIEPPAEPDTVDPPRPKHEALGDRAWWLYQAVRQVPLHWWTQHTGLQPAELLRWAAEGDWAGALHRGWRDVLFTVPEPAWCSAFVRQWPSGAGPDERASVLALLPLAEREAHWQRTLEADGLSDALLTQLDPGCPPPQHVSATLSQSLVTALLQRMAARPLSQDWWLREGLLPVAGLLHPTALPALQALPRRDDDTPSAAELLHSVQRIAAARTQLHERTPP